MTGVQPSLVRRTVLGGAGLFACMAAMLFGPAGTLHFWRAWLFLAVYFAWCAAVSVWLSRKNPALLARRMRGGPFAEPEPAQRRIMLLASAGFTALMVVPALDRRFGWSHTPAAIALAGDALVSLGWAAILCVFRANSFAASTVAVMPGQTVASTGPYAIVRHPMYAGAFFMLLGIPIALGSWWGVLPMAAVLPAMIWRLLDEERLLARDLPGYTDYQRTVRYRLIPGLW